MDVFSSGLFKGPEEEGQDEGIDKNRFCDGPTSSMASGLDASSLHPTGVASALYPVE